MIDEPKSPKKPRLPYRERMAIAFLSAKRLTARKATENKPKE